MATLGSIGVKLDLLIKQGSTFGPHEFTLTNPNGTPLNLTGCSIRAQMRKRAGDATATAALTTPITAPLAGKFTLSLSAAETTPLPAGETLKDPASKGVWDCELLDSLGQVTPLYYGDTTVFREVTRV